MKTICVNSWWGKENFIHPKSGWVLTRRPGETPDILTQHHTQCHVKTKRETEGDQGGGGEPRRSEREKQGGGGGMGTGSILTVLSIKAVRGMFRDLRGPNNSCRSLLQTLTCAHIYTQLGVLQLPGWHWRTLLLARWLNFSTARMKIFK